jgi:tetratricopeptide (TPR) repeat protein
VGSQQVYDQYLNLGHGFAWDKTWDKAVAAYARALQERPEDPDVHKFLGLALLEARRYNDAYKIYARAHILAPDDPVPLEKSADVLERLGRLKDAANQYISVAEIYLGQQDIDKAISNYERATLLTPGLLQIHYRLAQLYERTGKMRSAVLQYMTLAFNFQRAKNRPQALQAIERALRLEPSNPQVLNAKRAIEIGELINAPAQSAQDAATPKSQSSGFDDFVAPTPDPKAADSHEGGPLGESINTALADLAEALLESGLGMAEGQAIQAIELYKINDLPAAIKAFKNAEAAGIRQVSMYMCLGALYLQAEQWAEAKKYLDRAKNEPKYSAGAEHGMGQASMGLNQPREAVKHLILALQLADTNLAINGDEASQLKAVYDQLRQSSERMQDVDLHNMNAQFNRWLVGKDWKIRLPETRRILSDRIKSGSGTEITYYVGSPEVVEMVGRIDSLIRARMYTAAMDESFRAIEKDPGSLPIHQRVAQILMEQGQVQEAIAKYNIVANSFLARDDIANAAAILDEVIRVAPMDVGLRLSLIDLLQKQNQEDRMLNEYIGLADAYFQLAENEQARDTYQEALRLAQRMNAPVEKRSEILLKLADIFTTRMDFRQAQRTYEQIRNLTPEDDRPRKELIDLNYRMNNPLEAIKELDGLLQLYAKSKRGSLIVSTLEQMVNARSSDMALRSRLAAVYRQLRRNSDAIAQLDALGELQLAASLYTEACATIKLIITLQPSDISQYQELLTQLGC